jgi:hypothetical protein
VRASPTHLFPPPDGDEDAALAPALAVAAAEMSSVGGACAAPLAAPASSLAAPLPASGSAGVAGDVALAVSAAAAPAAAAAAAAAAFASAFAFFVAASAAFALSRSSFATDSSVSMATTGGMPSAAAPFSSPEGFMKSGTGQQHAILGAEITTLGLPRLCRRRAFSEKNASRASATKLRRRQRTKLLQWEGVK